MKHYFHDSTVVAHGLAPLGILSHTGQILYSEREMMVCAWKKEVSTGYLGQHKNYSKVLDKIKSN